MPPSCPWSSFTQGTLFFCESRLCGWVVEPASTWSNVGYFVVGAWLLARERRRPEPLSRVLGIVSILIGLGSTAYHATGTLVGETLDVAGMYLLMGLFVAIALKRLCALPARQTIAAYVGLVLATVLAKLLWPAIGIYVFFAEMIAALALEGVASRRPGARPDSYAGLVAALAWFGAAFVAWYLDVSRTWCDPDQHVFNGHALWHLLAAGSLYAADGFVRAQRPLVSDAGQSARPR